MASLRPTAAGFIRKMRTHQSDEELRKIQRYFKSGEGEYAEGDKFIGVRMGTVFQLAKEHVTMPPAEIEKLLESDIHEARAGALRIMADQFRARGTSTERRGELYELYLRRHDRINNWDLVDLAAWHVVGGWLRDKPRKPLYRLVASPNLWERRTGMLASLAFVTKGDLDDGFALAERLLAEPEELVQKAVGWVLRTAGDKDRARLEAFLELHAARMPRPMLRTAVEKFAPEERKRYLEKQRTASSTIAPPAQ